MEGLRTEHVTDTTVHFIDQVAMQNNANLQSFLTKCTVASFPETGFLCLQQESSLEHYIQLSVMLEYNHCMGKAKILLVTPIKLVIFNMPICVKSG